MRISNYYMESEGARNADIAKFILSTEWKPRKRGYSDLREIVLKKPIKENTEGIYGADTPGKSRKRKCGSEASSSNSTIIDQPPISGIIGENYLNSTPCSSSTVTRSSRRRSSDHSFADLNDRYRSAPWAKPLRNLCTSEASDMNAERNYNQKMALSEPHCCVCQYFVSRTLVQELEIVPTGKPVRRVINEEDRAKSQFTPPVIWATTQPSTLVWIGNAISAKTLPKVSKKCLEKWKTMSQPEKQRFFELAQKDAERYNQEVAAFGGEDAMRKRKRAKKDPNSPKRALSAFFFFSQIKRPEVQQGHPEWKVGQVAQELGRMWKDLTETEKKKYEEMAKNDKVRYEGEMRDYKAGGATGAPAMKKGRGAAASTSAAQSQSVDDEPDDDDD